MCLGLSKFHCHLIICLSLIGWVEQKGSPNRWPARKYQNPASRDLQIQRRIDQCLSSHGEAEGNFEEGTCRQGHRETALQKRAEDAEATLKPVVEELTGLKWQINAMTSAVFGKYPHLKLFNIHYLISFRFTDAWNDTRTRITHLGSDMRWSWRLPIHW